MDDTIKHDLLQHFANGFELLDTRPIYEWSRDGCVLSMAYETAGNFNPDSSPFIKKPLDWLKDSSIRQVNFCSAVQNFKSGCNEIYTLYSMLQNPGNMMRVHQSDAAANECMTSRILPMMQNNPKLKRMLSAGTYNAKTGYLALPNGMFLKSCGPSKNNLQSKTIKHLIIEELKFWENPQMLEEAIARTSRLSTTRKIIICSEPDTEGSVLHSEYKKGDEYIWSWRCKNCGEMQNYEMNGERDNKYYGLIWLPNNKAETLTYDERTNETKLVCQHCFHAVDDTLDDRLNLLHTGDYLLNATGSNSDCRSASWSTFVNPKNTFKSIALNYLDHKKKRRETGITEYMHRFYNKYMGVFIKKGLQFDMPKLMQEITSGDSAWEHETHRFMTIDVQQDCMYWLVLAGSNKVAEARLIDWGVCAGYDELVSIKKKYKILPMYISIDSGNDTKPIYKESVQRGELWTDVSGKKHFFPWLCLKGDGGKYSIKIDYDWGDGVKKYYGKETRPDCFWAANSPYKALRARLVLFSTHSVKTILCNVRDGKVPFKLKYNERADETFNKQMFSEEINPKTGRYDNFDRPNHLFDCMVHAVVLLLMSGCYIPQATQVVVEK